MSHVRKQRCFEPKIQTEFTQSEIYRYRRSVPGVSTHGRHSDYRVSKCRCGIHLLMCDGNSRRNNSRNGNRSWSVGTGYCNLYRCHHKLRRIDVFREIHRISAQWNRLLTEQEEIGVFS